MSAFGVTRPAFLATLSALQLSDYSVGPVTDMKKQIKTYLLRIISVTNPATHAMTLVLGSVLAGSSSSGESSQHIPRTQGKYLAKLLPKLHSDGLCLATDVWRCVQSCRSRGWSLKSVFGGLICCLRPCAFVSEHCPPPLCKIWGAETHV